jgi:hypothetical protein
MSAACPKLVNFIEFGNARIGHLGPSGSSRTYLADRNGYRIDSAAGQFVPRLGRLPGESG